MRRMVDGRSTTFSTNQEISPPDLQLWVSGFNGFSLSLPLLFCIPPPPPTSASFIVVCTCLSHGHHIISLLCLEERHIEVEASDDLP